MATPVQGAAYGNTNLSNDARAHLGNSYSNGASGSVGYDNTTANHHSKVHQGQYTNHGTNNTNTSNTYNYFFYGSSQPATGTVSLPMRTGNSPQPSEKVSPYPRYRHGTLPPSQVRMFGLYCSNTEPEILEIGMYNLRAQDLSNHKYTALSYSWSAGGTVRLVPLHVRIPTSAAQPETTYQALYVPSNLDLALRRIRSGYVSSDTPVGSQFYVSLWASSICVDWFDQTDTRQNSSHIPDIFRLSYRHIVWLGPGSDETDRAMKFASEAAVASNFQHLIAGEPGLEKCKVFMKLLQNTLFEHRSLVTELALSHQTMLICGDQQLDWQSFTVALEHFARSFDNIKLEARFSRHYSDGFAGCEVEGLPVLSLVQNISNLLRHSGPERIVEPLMNVEQLAALFARSSRWRDSPVRISLEALMPIAKRESRIPIPYHEPADELLYHLAASVIRRTRSLDILCQPWAVYSYTVDWPTYGTSNVPKSLATWIRSIHGCAFGIEIKNVGQRVNGDPFVSLASGHCIYDAAKGRRARYFFADWYDEQRERFARPEYPASSESNKSPGTKSVPIQVPSTRRITIDGFQIGSVTSVSEPIADGVIPSHILRVLGWDPGNTSLVPDKLLRSLVADRGPEGRSIPATFGSACKQAFDLLSPNDHLNTSRLLDRTTNATLRAFLKRVQAVVWNRRFFEVSVLEKGLKLPEKLHGFGPPDAWRGRGEMILCILFGCSVPCILRKMPNTENEYQFVGETYVYGLMDGEALGSLSEEEIDAKKVAWTLV